MSSTAAAAAAAAHVRRMRHLRPIGVLLLGAFLVFCLMRCNRTGRRRQLAADRQPPLPGPMPSTADTGGGADTPPAASTPVTPSTGGALAVAAPVGLSHEQMTRVVRARVMQATRASRDYFEAASERLARAQRDFAQFPRPKSIADRVEYVMTAKRAVTSGPAFANGTTGAATDAALLDATDEVVTAVEQACKDHQALQSALHQARIGCVQAAADYEADFVKQRAHIVSGALTAATQVELARADSRADARLKTQLGLVRLRSERQARSAEIVDRARAEAVDFRAWMGSVMVAQFIAVGLVAVARFWRGGDGSGSGDGAQAADPCAGVLGTGYHVYVLPVHELQQACRGLVARLAAAQRIVGYGAGWALLLFGQALFSVVGQPAVGLAFNGLCLCWALQDQVVGLAQHSQWVVVPLCANRFAALAMDGWVAARRDGLLTTLATSSAVQQDGDVALDRAFSLSFGWRRRSTTDAGRGARAAAVTDCRPLVCDVVVPTVLFAATVLGAVEMVRLAEGSP